MEHERNGRQKVFHIDKYRSPKSKLFWRKTVRLAGVEVSVALYTSRFELVVSEIQSGPDKTG